MSEHDYTAAELAQLTLIGERIGEGIARKMGAVSQRDRLLAAAAILTREGLTPRDATALVDNLVSALEATDKTALDHLAAIFPFAESRAEDMAENADADPGHPVAAETKALANAAWAKVEDARKVLRAAGRVPPLNPEKLALRGEPTAQELVARLTELLAIYAPGALIVAEARAYLSTRAPAEEAEQAVKDRDHFQAAAVKLGHENTRLLGLLGEVESALDQTHRFLSHTGNHRPLVGDSFTTPSARYEALKSATGATREALAAVRAATSDKTAIRQPAALPVEGRAPDASHEKKLGKKGAKP